MNYQSVAVEDLDFQIDIDWSTFKPKIEQLFCLGNLDLLNEDLFGLVCSSKCAGKIILQTYRLVKELARQGESLISGFHSPIEKDCLDTLLRAKANVVICPARGIQNMRTPAKWKDGIASGQILVISPFKEEHKQTSRKLAEVRNQLVGSFSNKILIPNAEPGSKTESFCRAMLEMGKPVLLSSDCENDELVQLGARSTDFSSYLDSQKSKT